MTSPNDDISHSHLHSPRRFINREISWLSFNRRVVELANSQSLPLLECLKFLAISANNLNEFFMVRVAGLRGQRDAKVDAITRDGMSIDQQLTAIARECRELHRAQQTRWKQLKDELPHKGIRLRKVEELSPKQLLWLNRYFEEQVFPVLTPIAVDPAHPFPFIKNLAIGLAIKLIHRKGHRKERELNGLILIPENSPQYIEIVEDENPVQEQTAEKDPENRKPENRKLDKPVNSQEKGLDFIHMHDLILAKINDFFPKFAIKACGFFQTIRDSEIEIEEEAEDLVHLFQSALKRRKRGHVVRLSVDQNMSPEIIEFLRKEFDLEEQDLYQAFDLLCPTHLFELARLDLPSLHFQPFNPRFPERIRDFNGDCFAAIAVKDIIVHHPFESFDVVVSFLKQAATDPDVLMIKQTLYRTSEGSPIISALIEAAEAGKSVTAMVELKARFDEEANIKWARDLERAGVQVIYGFVDLKTHAKISLVARRENKILRQYVHFGTGNYHPITARVYTDLSYFTCDPVLTADAGHLFNYMTSYAQPTKMQRLIAAPFNMRKQLNKLIDREIIHAKKSGTGSIWAKMNSLVDPEIIDHLYEASCAGVKIELVVRGICCLRPNIPGLSENIRVKSLVGRFLEHSRISCFGNGSPLPSKSASVFISSADWMPRNFDRRVEAMIPIKNPTVQRQVLDQIMLANLRDTENSWLMLPDGTYKRLNNQPRQKGEPETDNCSQTGKDPDQAEKAEKDVNQDHPETVDAHAYFITNPSLSGRGTAANFRNTGK